MRDHRGLEIRRPQPLVSRTEGVSAFAQVRGEADGRLIADPFLEGGRRERANSGRQKKVERRPLEKAFRAGVAPPAEPLVLDRVSMEAGITLSRWFGGEARRVYGVSGESEGDRKRRRLAEWISKRGGNVTPRELQQNYRAYPTAREAEQALDALVKDGLG